MPQLQKPVAKRNGAVLAAGTKPALKQPPARPAPAKAKIAAAGATADTSHPFADLEADDMSAVGDGRAEPGYWKVRLTSVERKENDSGSVTAILKGTVIEPAEGIGNGIMSFITVVAKDGTTEKVLFLRKPLYRSLGITSEQLASKRITFSKVVKVGAIGFVHVVPSTYVDKNSGEEKQGTEVKWITEEQYLAGRQLAAEAEEAEEQFEEVADQVEEEAAPAEEDVDL